MNKKIKIIELLNMIANGELKNNTKFNIINEDGDIIKCKYSSTYPGYIWVIYNEKISFNYKIDHLRILSYEVEILEDNTEEIEELDKNLKFDDLITPYGKNEDMMWTEIIKQHNKIDEIIRYIKRKDKDND